MNREGYSTDPVGAAEALQEFAASLRECSKCALCHGRTQVVFGVGHPQAELMFVGEGPGFHEDRLGEPFVGQAGKLLTELLGGIGLARADVYITNVVKCRPPENRDPQPEEIAACSPHLMQQVDIIKPRVVCTLGRFATKLLAETDLSMTAIHGKAKPRTLSGVKTTVFPVFHPAAALYAPANRQVLVEDFAKLRVLLERGLQAAAGPAAQEPAGVRPAPGTVSGTDPQMPRQAPSHPSPPREEQLHLW